MRNEKLVFCESLEMPSLSKTNELISANQATIKQQIKLVERISALVDGHSTEPDDNCNDSLYNEWRQMNQGKSFNKVLWPKCAAKVVEADIYSHKST